MLNRNEMVNEVLALYDALEGRNKFAARFASEGRDCVYMQCVSFCPVVRVESGKPDTFETWCSSAFSFTPPAWMSRNEFITEYWDELHETYQQALEDARNA